MPLPTVEQLTTQLASQLEDDASAVAGPADEALALVGRKVGAVTDVPDSISLRACLDVAAELYYRRKVRHGIVQLGDVEGGVQPVRVNRDPAAVADAILRPWLGPGIGA